MKSTMRAIEFTGAGGPEVVRLCDRPMPTPGPGEILLKVEAAGVNRPDVTQRRGFYPPPPGASDIPGLDVAGIVVEQASGAAGPAKGEAVCAPVTGGGYSGDFAVPVGQGLPPPQGF